MANELVVSDRYNSTKYLVLRLLRESIRPYSGRIIFAVICMFIVAGTTALHAWLMQPVIDDVFLSKDASMLAIVSLGVLAVSVAKGLATYGQNFLMQCLGQRIIADLQLKLYGHLLHLDISLINNESSGQIISRFTNDINALRASITVVLTGVAKDSITLIFLVTLMFYQSPTLAIIAFTAFPVAIYPILRLGKRMRKIATNTQEELGGFTTRLDETFKGIRVIKAYGQENFETGRAAKSIDNIYKLFVKAARNQSAPSAIMETIGGVAIAAVVWYGGSQVIEGGTTAGQFVSFITAVLMAYKPAKSLSKLNTILQEGLAAARRLFVLLDTKPQIVDKKDAVILEKAGDINFKNVAFQYKQDKKVIKGISLNVPKGKKIALVGSSGGGKSTIMNLILRFYDVNDGAIEINGTDIRDMTMASLRANIAFVSQDIVLFDDSIAANISYGCPGVSHEDVVQAAKDAAADKFIEELPDGYNTMIGQNGFTLSGGQRQRISIARAMIKNAPVLLLDEATSALDPISEKRIQKALQKLMKGRTSIVIAHRLSTVINSDVIYVIKNGKIVESGTHGELLKKKTGEYSKLYKGLE